MFYVHQCDGERLRYGLNVTWNDRGVEITLLWRGVFNLHALGFRVRNPRRPTRPLFIWRGHRSSCVRCAVARAFFCERHR